MTFLCHLSKERPSIMRDMYMLWWIHALHGIRLMSRATPKRQISLFDLSVIFFLFFLHFSSWPFRETRVYSLLASVYFIFLGQTTRGRELWMGLHFMPVTILRHTPQNSYNNDFNGQPPRWRQMRANFILFCDFCRTLDGWSERGWMEERTNHWDRRSWWWLYDLVLCFFPSNSLVFDWRWRQWCFYRTCCVISHE